MAILLTEILKQSILQRPETYERSLMHCLIQSVRFYRSLRPMLCPYNDKTFTYRSDFSVSRYNHLFAALDACWRMYDTQTFDADVFLPKETLENSLVDISNAAPPGSRVVETMAALLEELTSDFYAPNAAALASPEIMTALKGDVFSFWLDLRLAKHLNKEIGNRSLEKPLTLDDIQSQVSEYKTQTLSAVDRRITAQELARKPVVYRASISSGLPELDRRLGGGFQRKEVAMIAGSNGSGKTVLACQLAYNFAKLGYTVAYFTTEQSSDELLVRIVSNATSTPMNEFINRSDAPDQSETEDQSISCLPSWLYNDPRTAKPLNDFLINVAPRIHFVDWSEGQGHSVVSNLDTEIEKMASTNMNPDVIIVDWAGRALEQSRSKDDLRHRYKAAVDHLVTHVKKTNRVGIVVAQINKTSAKHRKFVEMDMLAECKTMTDNIGAFIGISSLPQEQDADGRMQLAKLQYLNVDKARKGVRGAVAVETAFQFQRFLPARFGGLSVNH